jgi:hypothetical protein
MRSPAVLLADVAGITVFAAVGRASHDESLGLLGVASTAWPFLGGWAVGVLATRAWRRPTSLATGVGVWAAAVAGGMLLRRLAGGGVQPAFVVVAALVLALILLGWRGVAALLLRRSRRTALVDP